MSHLFLEAVIGYRCQWRCTEEHCRILGFKKRHEQDEPDRKYFCRDNKESLTNMNLKLNIPSFP